MVTVMQVSRQQASRALAAMRQSRRRAAVRRRRSRGPAAGISPCTLDRVLRHIDDLPPVRRERVAAVSARRAAGIRPSSEAIADAALRRAACDRLR